MSCEVMTLSGSSLFQQLSAYPVDKYVGYKDQYLLIQKAEDGLTYILTVILDNVPGQYVDKIHKTLVRVDIGLGYYVVMPLERCLPLLQGGFNIIRGGIKFAVDKLMWASKIILRAYHKEEEHLVAELD